MNNETNKEESQARMLGQFNEEKIDKSKLRLFAAVYYDRTESALELIKTNPEQINEKDPFAGMTAIHIAIYRQNKAIVRALTEHPKLDMQVKDTFDRLPVDMLDYTQNQEIFIMVMDAHNPDSAAELEQIHQQYLEEFGEDSEEDHPVQKNREISSTTVVPFKPDNP